MFIAQAEFTGIINGIVLFEQPSEHHQVKVTIDINCIDPEEWEKNHGIHVHEKPITRQLLQCDNCCDKLGGHFNPYEVYHGSVTNGHVGDLCNNIFIDQNGNGFYSYIDPKISLIPGSKNCVLGRSVIIHQDEDDCGRFWRQFPNKTKMRESTVTGNAGTRISCANIYLIKAIV